MNGFGVTWQVCFFCGMGQELRADKWRVVTVGVFGEVLQGGREVIKIAK